MGGYAINIPPSFELTQGNSSRIGSPTDEIIFNCSGLNSIRVQPVGALNTDVTTVSVSMDGTNFLPIQTVTGDFPFFCSIHNWVYVKIKPESYSGTPYDIYWKGDATNVSPRVNQDGSLNVNISATSVEDTDLPRNIFNSVSNVAPEVETTLLQYAVPSGKRAFLVRTQYSGEQIALYKVYIDNIQQAASRTYHGAGLSGSIEFTDAISNGLVVGGGSVVRIAVIHNRPGVGQFDARLQVVEQNITVQVPALPPFGIDTVPQREEINLTPQLILQGVELQNVQSTLAIIQNSMIAFVDRVGIFENFDFQLSDTPGNKVLLTFNSNIIPLLDGTEVLRLTYLAKI